MPLGAIYLLSCHSLVAFKLTTLRTPVPSRVLSSEDAQKPITSNSSIVGSSQYEDIYQEDLLAEKVGEFAIVVDWICKANKTTPPSREDAHPVQLIAQSHALPWSKTADDFLHGISRNLHSLNQVQSFRT